MNVTILKSNPRKDTNDLLKIDDARIIFPNFSGKPDRFNKQGGKRYFTIRIDDQEIADALLAEGWNVKIKAPREEGGDPFINLKVNVNFASNYPPVIYLVSGENVRPLDEESIDILDGIAIASADMDLRAHDWINAYGESGRTAYANALRVYQNMDYVDRFTREYEHMNEEVPF